MSYRPAFWYEITHLAPDPVSGAPIRRLTSAAVVSHNIYCEQPYSSPDGQRVAIIRSASFNRDYPWCELWVADLGTHQIALVAPEVNSQIVNTAWGEHVFYWKRDGGFYRLSLLTAEEVRVLAPDTERPPVNCGLSISPDLTELAYGTIMPAKNRGESPRVGVVSVDLRTGGWRMLFEHPDMVNPHTQFEPAHGKTLLLQQNLRPVVRPDGVKISLGDGAVLIMVDRDGKNPRQLPVGPPHTSGCSGHQAFIPGTGRVALTTGRPHELPAVTGGTGHGNLLIVDPAKEQAMVFNAPEHYFSHVSLSRCGRFFVCDSYKGQKDPVPLIVGCFATGKYRTLVSDCHGTHGPNQWGHAHAYMTADNAHVIFNSEMHGPGQVYAARVPEGFLESLL